MRLGVQAKMGIRRAFRAGLDLDMIEMLAERYIYDETSHHYLDRESLIQELHFEHSKDDLTSQMGQRAVFHQRQATQSVPDLCRQRSCAPT